MEIQVQLTNEPVAEKIFPPPSGAAGARAEFRGIVRGEENGMAIAALEYEAYPGMAERQIQRLLQEISARHPCQSALVIHRLGVVPVGETAIYVGIAAKNRGPAFALLAEFMDRLKQDVPIWKRRAIPSILVGDEVMSLTFSKPKSEPPHVGTCKSLDEALAEIHSRCQPLPGVRGPLEDAAGRVLRETVFAKEDSPACDRSTRDGYAILQEDRTEAFSIVDTLHAADWKPRQLKAGEAVRVATGASLPCEKLRVVMQENVGRSGDVFKIIRQESAQNIRLRGEEWRAGDEVLSAGTKLDAGALALLAAAGCAEPLVSPRLRVLHFTTGDEIIAPQQTPKPGQVRDSNSILIRALLEKFGCEVRHIHLPEDFDRARQVVSTINRQLSVPDLLLVSGGASVGEKDFTRPLLEWLGFELVFDRLNLRPGAPLNFGVSGSRVAFGLPGNPLSHFVCLHLFVAAALDKLCGGGPRGFQGGILAEKLEAAPNPRETLWPAQLETTDGICQLKPLPWSSSGDVLVLAKTKALVRLPAGTGSLAAGAVVDFLTADF